MDRTVARRRLGLNDTGPVIVSVGWLIERKGFHRVIETLPDLVSKYPNLCYLIVGGDRGADNMESKLRQQVTALGLDEHVKFLGQMDPDDLKWPLSAAELFVLATRREGWANVFLEAMSCGLPVVTTDVGGNPEVVSNPNLGEIVPFGDRAALRDAIDRSLCKQWDIELIRRYAESNTWKKPIATLLGEYEKIVQEDIRARR
jgi:glycosyltransferase involved in cell wall biosynthesis